MAAALTFTSLSQDPFHQCDKQCRSAYGFYDRSITGARIGVFGQRCACHRAGEPLGEEQPWRSHKPWNESFWCGDFSTSLVCATEPAAAAPSVATRRPSTKTPPPPPSPWRTLALAANASAAVASSSALSPERVQSQCTRPSAVVESRSRSEAAVLGSASWIKARCA